MKVLKSILVFSFVIMLAAPAIAQKFAYVQSQKVLAEYQKYIDVQNRLEGIRNGYEAEYQ